MELLIFAAGSGAIVATFEGIKIVMTALCH
jgi:hypothetical protein